MMATILGIGSACVLIFTGYLFGAKRALQAREQLREQSMQQAKEQLRLSELVAHYAEGDADALVLRKDLVKMTQALLSQSDAVHKMLEPLHQREHLAYELSNLNMKSGDRSNLLELLDSIAEKGQFWSVSLHDEQGLLLGASRNAKNLDRLTVISAMVLLFAERIARDGGSAPLSLMVHDEANMATLCRIFHVGDQRLLLSAVATGAQLTPTALDPALSKVDAVLSTID
jgi:hypothetical protein